MNKYFVTRGKLVSRVAKYPGLQDYQVRRKQEESSRRGRQHRAAGEQKEIKSYWRRASQTTRCPARAERRKQSGK